jgi:hypothetical protein
MKIKSLAFLLTVAAISVSGFAVAGPGDKGKGSVTIKHYNGSEDKSGFIYIDVSVPGAVAHIGNHDSDCIETTSSVDAANEVADAVGEDLDAIECDFVGEE